MKDIKEILERLRPVLGKRTGELWALYLASDRDEQRELETTIRLIDLKANLTGPGRGPPDLPPPEPGVLDGWLRLGEVHYPSAEPTPFGLQQGEMIQHVGIFGRSGAGKTNTVMVVLKELIRNQTPFLIFDWKRNYRDLLAAPWVPEGSVTAFTAGRNVAPLRLNPLRPPPGTEARTWLKKMIEIIAHAYFLGEGVMFLLQEAIDACYKAAGVYDGGDTYPTFRDVHAYLKNRKTTGREANWMASTLRTTASLTFGLMAETVCSESGDDIGKLLEGNVILELDALTDSDKVLLVESLLLYIHHLRLAEPGREKLKHVLVIEEAHHIFLKSKQELGGGEPITEVILREIRELGEAVVLIDQHPSQIAITALGNTFCTIAMNLKHRADVTTISDACLLEPDEKDHLGRLPVGHAIVKLQDRWVSPFHVRFPCVSITKGAVTDAMLRNPAGGGSEPREKSDGITQKSANPTPISGCRVIPGIPVGPKVQRSVLLNEAAALLVDIIEEPGLGVTQRYSNLRISRRKGTRVKQRMLETGVIKETRVALPGGRLTLLEPTEKGMAVLRQRRATKRHGGVVHQYWVATIARNLRKRGFDVTCEAPCGGGKAIDLVADDGTENVAVEIEVSGRRLRESLNKLRATSASRKVLACSENSVADRARAMCRDGNFSDAIEIVHVWSFLAKSKKENTGKR